MTLNVALNAAISGLSMAQAGLNTVSNNIANVNTEGFTKKNFSAESVVLAGMGAGVQLGDIRNNVNQNLLEDLRNNRSVFGLLQTSSTYFKRVQDTFGTTSSNNSIGHRLNSLQNEFNTLSTDPENVSQQLSAVQAGGNVADQLAQMTGTVQGLRLDADREIQTAVAQLNTMLTSISRLNDQIALGAATQQQTEELEDKRDLALSQLSDLIDVRYFHNANGTISVFTNDGTTLVDSTAVNCSHVALTLVNPNHTYAGNNFTGIYAGVRDITSTIRSGKIKGLIEMRDKTLPDMQAQMDELSSKLMDTVNQIHNRGTSYPAVVNSYLGTRTFMSSANQTISMSGAETKVILYNPDGSEAFSDYMSNPAAGSINFVNGDTIDTVASKMQTWLQSLDPQLANASVAVNVDGHFAINLGTDSYGIAFKDETGTGKGSAQKDVDVAFDLDADGVNDQTFKGFANFLGLNDYFVTNRNLSEWNTSFKSSNYTLNIAAAQTLNFSDSTNPTGIAGGTITVNPGDSLETIRDAINSNASMNTRIKAVVVPEGNGKRLRIEQILGEQLAVTQQGGATDAIDALGLNFSTTGYSQNIAISDTLKDDPGRVSRGQVQYDALNGKYMLANGDNSIITQLGTAMSTQVGFNTAGSMPSGQITFSDYAASIIALSSTQAAAADTDLKFQSDLKDSLEQKNAELTGVNLDEELSQLLVFQQTYAASARVISTTSQLLDILNNLVT